jgi:hypothetical protein
MAHRNGLTMSRINRVVSLAPRTASAIFMGHY